MKGCFVKREISCFFFPLSFSLSLADTLQKGKKRKQTLFSPTSFLPSSNSRPAAPPPPHFSAPSPSERSVFRRERRRQCPPPAPPRRPRVPAGRQERVPRPNRSELAVAGDAVHDEAGRGGVGAAVGAAPPAAAQGEAARRRLRARSPLRSLSLLSSFTGGLLGSVVPARSVRAHLAEEFSRGALVGSSSSNSSSSSKSSSSRNNSGNGRQRR